MRHAVAAVVSLVALSPGALLHSSPLLGFQAPVPGGDQVVTLTDTLEGGVGGVTVDGAGIVYVADFGGTVWKVTPSGQVSTFVTSMYGSSGNAIDSKGNLLQSNFYGNFISRVDRAGNVEEFAAGLRGPVGIAIDADDNLFVTNCNGNTLSKVTPDGAVTEFTASELFACPNGITRDPQGNLYVVNFSNGLMLKVTPDGMVTEFATIPGGGNGHVTFARGTLYATSFRGHQVWRVSLSGEVSLLAGTGAPGGQDGPALEATLAFPNGIAASPSGTRLYLNEFRRRALGTELIPPASTSVVRQIKLASLTDVVVAALNTGGVDAVEPAYRAFKDDPANGGINTEFEANALGYRFMNTGQIEAALMVFELNTESYPQSWNVWDSLAEAHMNAGNNDRAIELYEKSIELNPNNSNGIAMLARLRGGGPTSH
jgi:sugar lactone lactonase YvrE